jgi:hypothetical protein
LNISDASGITSVQIALKGSSLWLDLVNLAGDIWFVDIDPTLPGWSDVWQASKIPTPSLSINITVKVTDGVGNIADPAAEIGILFQDETVPTVDVSELLALCTADLFLEPNTNYVVKINAPVVKGDTFIRKVILFLAPTAPATNTLDAWNSTQGVTKIIFSKIAADEWMAVVNIGQYGAQLHWAVYVQDYAGLNNSNSLVGGGANNLLKFGTPVITQEAEIIGGYVFMGVLAFGIIFSIAYQIQQGVVSVQKAKKVSTAVKKKTPSKSLSEPGKKQPVSKDIPTKICPICKAKIGADLGECPYCHKKF